MKKPSTTKLTCISKASILMLALLAASKITTSAADISWNGATASYTNAADWSGGLVPGGSDKAINNNTTNNVVQINSGDPDWSVNQIIAGHGGSGAFEQNGQTVKLSGTNVGSSFITSVRLGVAAGDVGVYTINNGTIDYTNGMFNVGEFGTGTLNINGGTITGYGNFAANFGVEGVPTSSAITATMDGGKAKGGFTWFEQGFYGPNLALGLPTAGIPFTSVTQPDHSFVTASYAASNVFYIATNELTATITLSTPAAYTALSILSSSADGPATNNYTIHYADASTQAGTIVIYDWFAVTNALNAATNAVSAGGRVDALGFNFNINGAGNFPRLFSEDITLSNPSSAVTSIDFGYIDGTGRSCIMALSGSTGSGFSPIAVTGYNEDMVVEIGAPVYVSQSVTSVVNQAAGAVVINGAGQMFVGNVGHGEYNLSGGTIDVHNFIAFARSSGSGIFNMTGGALNQDGGGNLVVATGFNNLGTPAVGVLNQSGGVITSQGEFWCPENAPGNATYNLSSTGAITVNNWFCVGRAGGAGTMNMTGGTVNKTGGGNFGVGLNGGSTGILNQAAGSITVNGETWIGDSGGNATYNMNGGSISGNNWFVVGRGGSTVSVLNLTNGAITKTGGNNNNNVFIVADGGTGTINQWGGVITNVQSATWIGNGTGGKGVWNMNAGEAYLGLVQIISANGIPLSSQLNLNGGIMTLQELTTGNPALISQLSLNGGTLRATADNANFLHDIQLVNVKAGGITIDSQGYNLTIAQGLPTMNGIEDNSGGLTKNGNGTLILSGANWYAGSTVVNGGALMTTTAQTGAGGVTVNNNGSGYGVRVVGALNSQLSVPNLTLSGPTNVLNFDLGSFGNPATGFAPLVVGTFTSNGTNLINVASSVVAVGTIPLMQYTTLVGAPNYQLGTLPAGVVASLALAGNVLELVVTSAGAPRWDGAATGVWSFGSNLDWFDLGTLALTPYSNGKPVLFDDNATGTTTVNLTATVAPVSVTFNNNTKLYTLVGSGSITGNIPVTKQATGTAIIGNVNSYTGPTVINGGGTLVVSNVANGGVNSAIGAATANPTNLVLQDSTFSYAGAPGGSTDRGIYLQGTNAILNVQSDLTLTGEIQTTNALGNRKLQKTGPAQLTLARAGLNVFPGSAVQPGYHVVQGQVLFNGSNLQTNQAAGELWVGGGTNYGASLVISNTVWNLNNWIGVGRGNGNINNTSTVAIHNSQFNVGNISLGYANGLPNLAHQEMTVDGLSVVANGGAFNLAESGGSTSIYTLRDSSLQTNGSMAMAGGNGSFATLILRDSAMMTNKGDVNLMTGTGTVGLILITNTASFGSVNRIEVGRSGGVGSIVVAGNGRLYDNQWFSIGNGNGGNGSLTAKDSANVYSGNDFNITDTGTSTGTVTVQDSAYVNGPNTYCGNSGGTLGTLNVSGGTYNSRNQLHVGRNINAVGIVNLSGGQITGSSELWVAEQGIGTWNQTGGNAIFTNWIAIGRNNSNAVGVMNISAGTFSMLTPGNRFIVGSGGKGTLNISGTAQVTSAGLMQMGENSGGANLGNGTLNLNGGTLTVPQIYRGAGVGVINFNGGTLKAGGGVVQNVFLNGLTSATIQSGGLTVDSAGNTFNIGQALLDGGGNGGLTKIGAGILRLNGTSTFTGMVNVNAGGLGGTGTLIAPVTVANNATLSPGVGGIGTLTLNSNLTLSALSTTYVEISLFSGVTNCDLVTGVTTLNYNGALVVSNTSPTILPAGGVFKLFNAASHTGTFTSVTILPAGSGTFNYLTGELTIAPMPPITMNGPTVSGGNLTLTASGGKAGGTYSLVTSTNLLLPLASWPTNSTGVFSALGTLTNIIPITSETNRFFDILTP